jgi:hypothetical protein
MLVGEKGSGKTLLSKNICVELAKQNVPTIVINHPWHGDKFNTLIQSIQQPCIVMFDEFEKVYNSDEQEQLLTLLDGIYSTKKLFLLTSNDKWRVDSHMRNRPGRIFYMVDFKGLDETFIREYCYDNLLSDTKTVDTIVSIASVFGAFNFDMLKALIEEMNRYGETPQEAMRILNVKAEFDTAVTYRVEVFKGERKSERGTTSWTGAPLSAKEICVNYYIKPLKKTESKSEFKTLLSVPTPTEDDDSNDDGWGDEDFTQDDLVRFNNKTGQFIFEKNGLTLILVKDTPKYFNFDAF